MGQHLMFYDGECWKDISEGFDRKNITIFEKPSHDDKVLHISLHITRKMFC